ncbi:MAG: MFS transporter [Chloroflexi bacterium]|nr:MFS transporter [Chloroflexota bacterium]
MAVADAGYIPLAQLDDKEYKRRIRAWALYDWANSAFATTILAAVLPVYFSSVAGSTLPSEATATAYWSLGLSVSLLIVAILSPLLGTVSDVMRGKKLFLAIFAGTGILGTALLVFVGTGDWILASAFAIIGRIGFNGSITFSDALLPHIAKEDDQDRVSSLGFDVGYLGGGILLAINVVMLQVWGFEIGSRVSFVSVALWWLIFTIPLFVVIPEPPADTEELGPGESIVSVSFARLRETLGDLSRYRELFRYLIAFLIYNDGIGTIIGIAAIYATELGFGALETILALLLVQFVGIPFTLIFRRITNPSYQHRAVVLAFVVFNLILLPVVGAGGRLLLPLDVSGAAPPPFEATDTAVGEGLYLATGDEIRFTSNWEETIIPADQIRPPGLIGFLNNPFGGPPTPESYFTSDANGAQLDIAFNGQQVRITHSTGPDHGIWAVQINGEALLDDEGEPVIIDAYNEAPRFNVRSGPFAAEEPGEHVLSLVNTGDSGPDSAGTVISVFSVEVLQPSRAGGFGVIGLILGILVATNLVALLLAVLLGKALFGRIAETIDTKRGILLALVVYGVIAVWGFFLDSTIEFWFIAWMVAIVQGGSQGLSRSLYAAMSPAAKSGEFFGLFSIMEKFASLLGPLVFAAAGFLLGSSRWGILALILFFLIGGGLLTTVNVEEGKRVAQEEDRKILGDALAG